MVPELTPLRWASSDIFRRSSAKERALGLARRPRHRARLLERGDGLVVVAGVAQDTGGVLAQARAGRAVGVARRARELDRDAEQADGLPGPRLVELGDHLARPDQLGVQRLVEAEDGLQAAVVLAGEGRPVLARARLEDLLDLRVRLAAGALELLLDEVLAADPAAPVLPELRLQRTQRHPAVGALVGAVADQRAGELGVAALGRLALAEVAGGDHGQPAQR